MVVLIIGILAAIAVAQYFKIVEKEKFAESMQWVIPLTRNSPCPAGYGCYAAPPGTLSCTSWDCTSDLLPN